MRGTLRVAAVGFCFAAAACSSPAPPPPKPPPVEPGPAPQETKPAIAYELPEPSPAQGEPLVCKPQRVVHSGGKRKTRSWDFSGDTVTDAPGGPRLAEAGSPSGGRLSTHVRTAVRVFSPYFRDCYRWVRFGGRRSVDHDYRLNVALAVDPSGAVAAAEVSPEDGSPAGADRLATCIKEGLEAVRLQHVSASLTTFRGTMEFSRSDLGKPRKRARRPKAPARPKQAADVCRSIPAKLPQLSVAVGQIARFDDWETGHWQDEDDRRRRAAARNGATVPRRPPLDCAIATYAPQKIDLRQMVRSNLGAYRACYRAALERTPDLEGTITLVFRLSEGTRISEVNMAGGGDDELHDCIAAAFTELSGYSGSRFAYESTVLVRYPLTFSRAERAAPTGSSLERARALLARGDNLAAAEQFAAAIRDSEHGPDECEGRVGVLESMLSEASTPLDSRVVAAASDVARYAASSDARRATGDCRDKAAMLTARAATWPLPQRDRVPDVWRSFGIRYRDRGLLGAAKRSKALRETWPDHPLASALVAVELEAAVRSGRSMDESTIRGYLRDADASNKMIETYSKTLASYRAAEVELTRIDPCSAMPYR